MIHDLLNETPPPGFLADICIVGAGAAGITLGVEFARRGKKVLLLEGGGTTREDSSQALYDSEIAGLPPARAQAENLAGDTASTGKIMSACRRPQNSAHSPWKRPARPWPTW